MPTAPLPVTTEYAVPLEEPAARESEQLHGHEAIRTVPGGPGARRVREEVI